MSKKDWAADERKLQSVYDDVQSSKHKLALAQVDRFLKKQPKSQPALVLRAFLFDKLGQNAEEVLKVWKAVEVSGELTPRSMWFAGLLMRNLGRTDILVNLYSKHWDARPDSGDLGQQVVLLATSIWDTKTMCSASRKMFNLLKTTTWARVAAWAEWADKTPTPPSDTSPFPPPAAENALRIATTLLSTTRKKITSGEVLWLHIQILLGSGQNDAAVTLVREEGVGGAGIDRNWWRLKTVQEVLRRKVAVGEAGREVVEKLVKEEMEDFVKILKKDVDIRRQRNWANYDHILQLIATHPTSTDIDIAKALFSELDESIGKKERAPALALLHLDNRMTEGRMSDEEYKEAVERYWRIWGSKGVVMDDLQGQWEGREGVLASPLQTWSEEQHIDLSSYLAGKHARLLLFRLKAKGWEATEDEFKWTWAYYLAGAKYGSDMPDTDIRPADEIGLAAVQILLHLWRAPVAGEENRELYLFRAIVCLRKICEDSPACVQARYLLIRLYRLVGAPSLAIQPLEQIKLVEIQLDTLLHIYTERASVDVFLGQSEVLFESIKERAEYMYRKTSNDASCFSPYDRKVDHQLTLQLPQYVQQALENESYSQITSIRQLQSTLSTSLPAAILAIESQRMGLLQRVSVKGSDPNSLNSRELVKARDADAGVDTRNWELVPMLVGELPMGEVLSLGMGGGREWIRTWREIFRCVDSMAGGDEVKAVTEGVMSVDEGMTSSAELAALKAIVRILEATQAVLVTASDSGGDAQAPAELENVSQDVIQLAKSDSGSRWDKLQSAILFTELSRIVHIASTRLAETIKPKNRNKKTTPSPALKELATTIQALQTRLQEGSKEIATSLEGLSDADETFDWAEMMDGSDVETDLVEKVRKEVLGSRRSALGVLRTILVDM